VLFRSVLLGFVIGTYTTLYSPQTHFGGTSNKVLYHFNYFYHKSTLVIFSDLGFFDFSKMQKSHIMAEVIKRVQWYNIERSLWVSPKSTVNTAAHFRCWRSVLVAQILVSTIANRLRGVSACIRGFWIEYPRKYLQVPPSAKGPQLINVQQPLDARISATASTYLIMTWFLPSLMA